MNPAPASVIAVIATTALVACAPAARRAPAPTAFPADPLRAHVRDAAAHGFAGNVLVRRHGRDVLFDSVGLASEALGVPHQRTTRFKIHSVSKPITAAAVLALAADGKLDLDQPVSAALPALPATWRAITPRQLLQHTAGIPPEAEQTWFDAWAEVDSGDERDVLAVAGPRFPDHLVSPPGQSWAYSNLGYTLLGCLVARQAGMPFAQYLQDRVFAPAGMRDTVLDAQAAIKHPVYSGNAVIPRLADGYNGAPGALETTYSKMYTERGAGGVITTVDDLARFAGALWRGTLLPDAVRAQILAQPYRLQPGTDREVHYGLGWMERRRDGHRVVSHDGGTNGFVAALSVWPDDDLVIVVLSNRGFFDGLSSLVNDLARTALATP